MCSRALTLCRSLLGIAFFLAVFTTADSSEGTPLYGITAEVGGELSLVEIDTSTGQATEIVDIPVGSSIDPQNLTYHTPSGKFLARKYQSSGSSPALVILDPVAATSTVVPITGLPANHEKINGVAYNIAEDQIVVSFGTFPSHEYRIAEIDLGGNVLNLSPDLGLGDRDTLVYDPTTENLLAFDTNGDLPRLASVSDPFGSMSVTPVASPPYDLDMRDLAVSPDTGEIFITRDDELLELVVNTDSYSLIGTSGLPQILTGIAFGAQTPVPEPSTYALAAIGLLGLGFIGWRRKRA